MTILVETQDRLIVKAAPIARKFVGQPLNNLSNWMRKQGGFKIHKYDDSTLPELENKCDT